MKFYSYWNRLDAQNVRSQEKIKSYKTETNGTKMIEFDANKVIQAVKRLKYNPSTISRKRNNIVTISLVNH